MSSIMHYTWPSDFWFLVVCWKPREADRSNLRVSPETIDCQQRSQKECDPTVPLFYLKRKTVVSKWGEFHRKCVWLEKACEWKNFRKRIKEEEYRTPDFFSKPVSKQVRLVRTTSEMLRGEKWFQDELVWNKPGGKMTFEWVVNVNSKD